MPKKRWIDTNDGRHTVSALARKHGLKAGTLSGRLRRYGYTDEGVMRALTERIMTCSESGRLGFSKSHWNTRLTGILMRDTLRM